MMSADNFATLAETMIDGRDQELGRLRLKQFNFAEIKETIKNERFIFDNDSLVNANAPLGASYA